MTIRTPCTSICVVHRREGLCIGCLRTADEIARWSAMTDAERDEIMAELPARAPRLQRRKGGRAGRLSDSGSATGG